MASRKNSNYGTLQSQWLLILSILFRPFPGDELRTYWRFTVYFAANKFMINIFRCL